MKTAALLLLTLGVAAASAQPVTPVPPTTPFTRYVLGATNQNDFVNRAGLGPTAVPTVPFLDPGIFNNSGQTIPAQINNALSAAAVTAANIVATNIPDGRKFYFLATGNDANSPGTNAAFPVSTLHCALTNANAYTAGTGRPSCVYGFAQQNFNEEGTFFHDVFSNYVNYYGEPGCDVYVSTNIALQPGGAYSGVAVIGGNPSHFVGMRLHCRGTNVTMGLIGFYGKTGGDSTNTLGVNTLVEDSYFAGNQAEHVEGNASNLVVNYVYRNCEFIGDNIAVSWKASANQNAAFYNCTALVTNQFGTHNGSNPIKALSLASATGSSFLWSGGSISYADTVGIPAYAIYCEGGGTSLPIVRNAVVYSSLVNGLSADITTLTGNGGYGGALVMADVRRADGNPLVDYEPTAGQSGNAIFLPGAAPTTLGGPGLVYWTNNTPTAGSYPVASQVETTNHLYYLTSAGMFQVDQQPDLRVITSGNMSFVYSQNSDGSSNVTATVTNVPSSTVQGAAANTPASAGIVGEQCVSNVAPAIAVSLSSGTPSTITNLFLTAGQWLVGGNVVFIESSATVTARAAAFNTGSGIGANAALTTTAFDSSLTTVTSQTNSVTLPMRIINLSANTTYNLNAVATFSAGTVSAFGQAVAIRFF